MNCENVMLAEIVEPMSLPLFQPLRLWKSRPLKVRVSGAVNKPVSSGNIPVSVRTFAMKGGYVSDSDGTRRMVIAGKIFKKEER